MNESSMHETNKQTNERTQLIKLASEKYSEKHKAKEYNRLSAIEWINTNLMKSWLTSLSTIIQWGGKCCRFAHTQTHTTKMTPIMEWQIVDVCVARSLPCYIAMKFSCDCVRPWWFIWSFDCLSSVPFHQYFSFDLSVRDKYSFVQNLYEWCVCVASLMRTKWFHTTWMSNLTHPSVIKFFLFCYGWAHTLSTSSSSSSLSFFFYFLCILFLKFSCTQMVKEMWITLRNIIIYKQQHTHTHTHERMAKEHVNENKSKALSR